MKDFAIEAVGWFLVTSIVIGNVFALVLLFTGWAP